MKNKLKLVLTLVLSLCMVAACTSQTQHQTKHSSQTTKTSTKVTSSSSSSSTSSSSFNSQESQSSTFSNQGLATEGMTPNILDIDQNGILLLDVQTGQRSNITLYIVPANTTFSSNYLNGQDDNTDISKDRVISSADIGSGDLASKAYYHVSNQKIFLRKTFLKRY